MVFPQHLSSKGSVSCFCELLNACLLNSKWATVEKLREKGEKGSKESKWEPFFTMLWITVELS